MTYEQRDIGRYHREHVRLVDHFAMVASGRVHRVVDERVVADTKAEVRRPMPFRGLPFEDTSLRFYDNERAVCAANAAEVRRPLNRNGIDQRLNCPWLNCERWLDPLKEALGAVLYDDLRLPRAASPAAGPSRAPSPVSP